MEKKSKLKILGYDSGKKLSKKGKGMKNEVN